MQMARGEWLNGDPKVGCVKVYSCGECTHTPTRDAWYPPRQAAGGGRTVLKMGRIGQLLEASGEIDF